MNATVEEQFDDFLRRIEVAISVARMRADNDSYLCNITIGDVQIMVNEIKWRRYRDDQLRAEVEALKQKCEALTTAVRWLPSTIAALLREYKPAAMRIVDAARLEAALRGEGEE